MGEHWVDSLILTCRFNAGFFLPSVSFFLKFLMELSSSQIEEFEERGFLFFPELLKSHEVKLLTDHLEGLYSLTGPEVVREK